MKIIDNKNLAEVFKKINPTIIATAFIGDDFKRLFPNKNVKSIEKIVISSAFIQNPEPVKLLAKLIGWEKIFFNNRLHSKIYIGKESALITSANLTENGFNEDRLIEIGIAFDNSLDVLATIVDSYIDKNQTEDYKLSILNFFETSYSIIASNRIFKNLRFTEGNAITFKEFYERKDFKITKINFLWWDDYNTELIRQKDRKAYLSDKRIYDGILSDIPKKLTHKNRWFIYYRVKRKNSSGYHLLQDRKNKIDWLYMHEQMDIASDSKQYFAVEFYSKYQDCPVLPFKIDSKFKMAFKKLIEDPKFTKYFIPNIKDKVIKLNEYKKKKILTVLYEYYTSSK